MSPKSLALIGAAALVLAAGVYLFIQVRTTPAQAGAPGPSAVAPQDEEPRATTPVVDTPAPQARAPETRGPRPESRSPAIRPQPAIATPEPATDEEAEQRANPRMDSMMELANKAYDRQDFDEAIAIASKVLTKDPTNVRMLRVVVSANCIAGDSAIAQSHYEKLPTFDRDQMKQRCERYGVMLKDP